MNKKLLIQSALSVAVISLLVATTSHNSMMSMNATMARTLPYAGVALLCILVATFLFEHAGDERDVMHQMTADRCALFTVMLVLGAAVFFDQLHETFNPWIIGALCAALLTKMVSRLVMYSKD